MAARAELNEYLQGILHESPKIRFVTSFRAGVGYVVTIKIWSQAWTSEPVWCAHDGRLCAINKALSELKQLKTEAAVRGRLGLAPMYRNQSISNIRGACKDLKALCRQHGRRDLICLLVRIYPIVNEVEANMQAWVNQ